MCPLSFAPSNPPAPICVWPHLIVEEVHGMVVEFEWQGLEEGDIVGHDLLVREVKLVDDDGVHVVVRQQVICEEKEKRLGQQMFYEDAVNLAIYHLGA